MVSTADLASVVISAKGEDRIRRGHPWIYQSDVRAVQGAPGAIVRVVGPGQRALGSALFSEQSQITLRMLTVGERMADGALIRERVARAAAFRRSLGLDATAYRVVHGEADLLPSLVVDKYGDYLVVQALSAGMDQLLPEVVAALNEEWAPAGILARHDPKVRSLEGLDRAVVELAGSVPRSILVREGSVEYDVDVWSGQKTGLFLDQRENREAAARYARGRLLDCFSYNGGFALRLAPHCDSAEAIDVSGEAVDRIKVNADRNGLQNVQVREANVFDELRQLERAGQRYDTIVLDPPAFAKNKASVQSAVAGYKEINLRAMHLLSPGGVLVTCSCSYNVDEVLFEDILAAAAADSRTAMTVLEKRTQGRDHPVLLGVPETYYLKCFILRRVE